MSSSSSTPISSDTSTTTPETQPTDTAKEDSSNGPSSTPLVIVRHVVPLRPPPVHRACFHRGGMAFRVQSGPMLSLKEMDDESWKMPGAAVVDGLPDATFGHNLLAIEGRGFRLRMDTRGLIRGSKLQEWPSSDCIPPTEEFNPSSVVVDVSDVWRRKALEAKVIAEVEDVRAEYDWTFSSKYWGDVSRLEEAIDPQHSVAEQDERQGFCEFCEVADSLCRVCSPIDSAAERREPTDESVLPMEELKDQSLPILWFQHVDLYQDELSDSGLSRGDIRVRVMPTFWLLLLKQEVRVDRVLIREISTRVFHRFDSCEVIREYVWKECPWSQLLERGNDLGPGSPELAGDRVGTHLLLSSDVRWRYVQKLPLRT